MDLNIMCLTIIKTIYDKLTAWVHDVGDEGKGLFQTLVLIPFYNDYYGIFCIQGIKCTVENL